MNFAEIGGKSKKFLVIFVGQFVGHGKFSTDSERCLEIGGI